MSNVLVTGATGKQGGAVARELLGKGHRVRALTRKATGQAAQELARLGAEVVTGDLEDRGSLDAAMRGVDAVFAAVTPFEAGTEAETRQGIHVADAAKAAGVYLVYSSVANADRHTGIPHFDSKAAVEEHIQASGMTAAIIAPAYFMENVFFGLPHLKQGIYGSPMPADRALVQVSVADIAAASVAALLDPARHAGKRYDLGTDELTGAQTAAILAKAIGAPISYVQVPMEAIRGSMGEDGVKMYEWFTHTGYTVDRAAMRRAFPAAPWLSFEAWANAQNWKQLLAS
jgi:uncharacterized protein YbjT (DUF2867 family)